MWAGGQYPPAPHRYVKRVAIGKVQQVEGGDLIIELG
jgi:hypothetical protein